MVFGHASTPNTSLRNPENTVKHIVFGHVQSVLFSSGSRKRARDPAKEQNANNAKPLGQHISHHGPSKTTSHPSPYPCCHMLAHVISSCPYVGLCCQGCWPMLQGATNRRHRHGTRGRRPVEGSRPQPQAHRRGTKVIAIETHRGCPHLFPIFNAETSRCDKSCLSGRA